jgi:hypothetical protein
MMPRPPEAPIPPPPLAPAPSTPPPLSRENPCCPPPPTHTQSSFLRSSLYTLFNTPPTTADNVDAGLDCCCRTGAPWELANVDFSFSTRPGSRT